MASSPDLPIYASIVMATHRKPQCLDITLKSICCQKPPFAFEVIVVDDGSGSEANRDICTKYGVRFSYLEGSDEYRNPGDCPQCWLQAGARGSCGGAKR